MIPAGLRPSPSEPASVAGARSPRWRPAWAMAAQVEVLSLVGDIATEGDRPKVHAHVVVGRADGQVHGGHLLAARVRPTLEVILDQPPSYRRRRFDPESGLALIEL